MVRLWFGVVLGDGVWCLVALLVRRKMVVVFVQSPAVPLFQCVLRLVTGCYLWFGGSFFVVGSGGSVGPG